MSRHTKPFSYFASMGYQVTGVNALGQLHCWECIPLNADGVVDEEGYSIRGYSEGPAIECDECGRMIESDYGDPEGD